MYLTRVLGVAAAWAVVVSRWREAGRESLTLGISADLLNACIEGLQW